MWHWLFFLNRVDKVRHVLPLKTHSRADLNLLPPWFGFHTYRRRSHMRTKNRNKSHSRHQPILLSHLPSSYYLLFLNTSLAPSTNKSARRDEMLLFCVRRIFKQPFVARLVGFPGNWIETKLRIRHWQVARIRVHAHSCRSRDSHLRGSVLPC